MRVISAQDGGDVTDTDRSPRTLPRTQKPLRTPKVEPTACSAHPCNPPAAVADKWSSRGSLIHTDVTTLDPLRDFTRVIEENKNQFCVSAHTAAMQANSWRGDRSRVQRWELVADTQPKMSTATKVLQYTIRTRSTIERSRTLITGRKQKARKPK